MTDKHLAWKADLSLPTSKSTLQHFTAEDGADRLTIDTSPWGEADLAVNGRPVAHIDAAPSAGDAFRTLEVIAEDFEAARAATGNARLDQAIEDDEVRERLGLRRSPGDPV